MEQSTWVGQVGHGTGEEVGVGAGVGVGLGVGPGGVGVGVGEAVGAGEGAGVGPGIGVPPSYRCLAGKVKVFVVPAASTHGQVFAPKNAGLPER